MKTLSDMAERERVLPSKDVFYLFEMVFPEEVRRFSTRPLICGGQEYEPVILGVKSFSQDISPDGMLGRSEVVVELADGAAVEDAISTTINLLGLEGCQCRLGVLFMDAEKTATLQDVIWLGEFMVNEVDYAPTFIRLYLLDPLTFYSGREMVRVLGRDALPGLSPGEHFVPSVIFGKNEGCPVPLFPYSNAPQKKFSLVGELEPEAQSLRLDDVASLPPLGTLQVGVEVLGYRGTDRLLGTVGSEGSPLIRPQPGYHQDGAPVRFLPEEGLFFLVADHPCKGVSDVRANGRPVPEDEFSLVTATLKGRQACFLRLDRWPVYARNASGASLLRFDGLRTPDSWIVKDTSSSLHTDRAVDGFPGITAARLDSDHSMMSLCFRESLKGGAQCFGALTRAFIEVQYFASGSLQNRASVMLRVAKGGAEKELSLPLPERESSVAILPEERLSVSGAATGENAATTVFPQNSCIVPFDEVQGESVLGGGNYRWKDSANAKDGHFGSYTVNFAGPSVFSNAEPLILRLRRRPMLDSAATLAGIHFHAVMDSNGTSLKDVRLAIRLADRFNGAANFRVDGQKREYVYEVPLAGVTFEQLVDSVTDFRIEVPDGTALRIYESWLEILYRLKPPLTDSGAPPAPFEMEGLLSQRSIELPTQQVSHCLEITEMVMAGGGWEFFRGDESGPVIEMDFSGSEGSVHISDVALLLEYRPLVGEVMAERLTATVEGLCENGVLLRNPADVVHYILTGKEFMDFPSDRVDEDSFNSMREHLTSAGLVCDIYLSQRRTVRELLLGVLKEAGIRLVCESGKFRLLGKPFIPSELGESHEVSFSFSEPLLLEPEPVVHVEDEAVENGPRASLLLPLNCIHMERGDRVSVSCSSSNLDGATGEIIRCGMPEPDLVELQTLLTGWGSVCWRYDEGTFLWRLKFGRAMVFSICGKTVARLEKNGDLFLLGEGREHTLDEDHLPEPVQFDPVSRRLLFGAGTGSDYMLVFAIDADGNLLTRGEVVEKHLPVGLTSDAFYKSIHYGEEYYFVISLDLRTCLLSAARSTAAISLRGEIIEKTK
jgi:hypothetical protein